MKSIIKKKLNIAKLQVIRIFLKDLEKYAKTYTYFKQKVSRTYPDNQPIIG